MPVNGYYAGTNDYVQTASYYDGNGRLAQFERHLGDLQQASLSDAHKGMFRATAWTVAARVVNS